MQTAAHAFLQEPLFYSNLLGRPFRPPACQLLREDMQRRQSAQNP